MNNRNTFVGKHRKKLLGLLLCGALVLAGCGQGREQTAEADQREETELRMECFDQVEGDYDVQECKDEDNFVGWYWHLAFFRNEKGPYFTIYDDEAGNPGVEGYIVAMDEDSINVEIDDDYYEELPKENWTDEDGFLYLQYELTEDGIRLTNGGKETLIEAIKEIE